MVPAMTAAAISNIHETGITNLLVGPFFFVQMRLEFPKIDPIIKVTADAKVF